MEIMTITLNFLKLIIILKVQDLFEKNQLNAAYIMLKHKHKTSTYLYIIKLNFRLDLHAFLLAMQCKMSNDVSL